jgi:hypothetical protein
VAVTASPRGPLTRPGGLRSPVPASRKSRSVGPAAGFGVLPDRPADASDPNVGCDVRHSKCCRGPRAVAAAPSLVRVGRARFATASRPVLPVAALVHRVGGRRPVRLDDSGPGSSRGRRPAPSGDRGRHADLAGRPRGQRAVPNLLLWQERVRRWPEASSTHVGRRRRAVARHRPAGHRGPPRTPAAAAHRPRGAGASAVATWTVPVGDWFESRRRSTPAVDGVLHDEEGAA